jgi:hypothetical protein
MDDARRIVQTRFALHFDGARPYALSQTLFPVARGGHLARAYAMAGRERKAYLLIAPVSTLLLGMNYCWELAPAFQLGLADYLAISALFHAEPRYWPAQWEAQTSGEPARMAAELARHVPGVRLAAAGCYLRTGPMRLRTVVNGFLRTGEGFAVVEGCFARRSAARLTGILRDAILIDGQQLAGKRA